MKNNFDKLIGKTSKGEDLLDCVFEESKQINSEKVDELTNHIDLLEKKDTKIILETIPEVENTKVDITQPEATVNQVVSPTSAVSEVVNEPTQPIQEEVQTSVQETEQTNAVSVEANKQDATVSTDKEEVPVTASGAKVIKDEIPIATLIVNLKKELDSVEDELESNKEPEPEVEECQAVEEQTEEQPPLNTIPKKEVVPEETKNGSKALPDETPKSRLKLDFMKNLKPIKKDKKSNKNKDAVAQQSDDLIDDDTPQSLTVDSIVKDYKGEDNSSNEKSDSLYVQDENGYYVRKKNKHADPDKNKSYGFLPRHLRVVGTIMCVAVIFITIFSFTLVSPEKFSSKSLKPSSVQDNSLAIQELSANEQSMILAVEQGFPANYYDLINNYDNAKTTYFNNSGKTEDDYFVIDVIIGTSNKINIAGKDYPLGDYIGVIIEKSQDPDLDVPKLKEVLTTVLNVENNNDAEVFSLLNFTVNRLTGDNLNIDFFRSSSF